MINSCHISSLVSGIALFIWMAVINVVAERLVYSTMICGSISMLSSLFYLVGWFGLRKSSTPLPDLWSLLSPLWLLLAVLS